MAHRAARGLPVSAALGVQAKHRLKLSFQHLMGLRIPRVEMEAGRPGTQFGVGGTSASTDMAMRRFTDLVPLLADLAELENAVLRLARQRLLGGASARALPGAAAQQGLMQMVRDFCDHSNALCAECPFPRLVRELGGETSSPEPGETGAA